jgi:hypothetical protein
MQSLIEQCIRYMEASKLPSPLPTNPAEYATWREKAAAPRGVDEESEDAWFELDRLLTEDSNLAWELLTQLTDQCNENDEICSQIATGPLNTFLHANADAFSSRIEEELMKNRGFRAAYYRWRA